MARETLRFPLSSERCPPFAVAPIEDQHPVAGLAAKHIAQIVGLGGVQSEAGAALSGVATYSLGVRKS